MWVPSCPNPSGLPHDTIASIFLAIGSSVFRLTSLFDVPGRERGKTCQQFIVPSNKEHDLFQGSPDDMTEKSYSPFEQTISEAGLVRFLVRGERIASAVSSLEEMGAMRT